jgi:hypothetical protein
MNNATTKAIPITHTELIRSVMTDRFSLAVLGSFAAVIVAMFPG